MTDSRRREEIFEAAQRFIVELDDQHSNTRIQEKDVLIAFREGARWADSHPTVSKDEFREAMSKVDSKFMKSLNDYIEDHHLMLEALKRLRDNSILSDPYASMVEGVLKNLKVKNE